MPLRSVFAEKDQKFYGIMNLSERWQKAIEQNGKYIIDETSFLALKKIYLNSFKKLANSYGISQYIAGIQIIQFVFFIKKKIHCILLR